VLAGLWTLRDFEFYALAFSQAAEAVGLNGEVMDEYVLTALALDKTKTLGVAKPLPFLVPLIGTLLSSLKFTLN